MVENNALESSVSDARLMLLKPVEQYIDFIEKLSVRSVPLLARYAEHGVLFEDRDYSVRGLAEMGVVLEKRSSGRQPLVYKAKDYVVAGDSRTVFVEWSVRSGSEECTCMSKLMFSPAGKVFSHTEYWLDEIPAPKRSSVTRRFLRRMLFLKDES